MRRVGVVGAGVAAAATAFALRDSGADGTVLEAAPDIGGRAGSRRHDGCVYDHGTNYLKADDERVVGLVAETLSTE
jgi:predicted NAD/FAD-dependent oxidoreductase